MFFNHCCQCVCVREQKDHCRCEQKGCGYEQRGCGCEQKQSCGWNAGARCNCKCCMGHNGGNNDRCGCGCNRQEQSCCRRPVPPCHFGCGWNGNNGNGASGMYD